MKRFSMFDKGLPVMAGAMALALSGCMSAPEAPKPPPELPGKVVKYTCTGSSHVSVTYGEGKVTVAGETLIQEEGKQRWSWPSDGTHHIWELGGDGLGTLSLNAAGKITVLNSGCKADAKAG